MKGDNLHDIPFYQIMRRANSLNDMIFCPIAFLDPMVTRVQAQALEFMVMALSRPKMNYPFAQTLTVHQKTSVREFIVKGEEIQWCTEKTLENYKKDRSSTPHSGQTHCQSEECKIPAEFDMPSCGC